MDKSIIIMVVIMVMIVICFGLAVKLVSRERPAAKVVQAVPSQAQKTIDRVLLPGEKTLVRLAPGIRLDVLVATDRRILFVKRISMMPWNHQMRVSEFMYQHINGVDFRPGNLEGLFMVATSSTNFPELEANKVLGFRVDEPWQKNVIANAPNAIGVRPKMRQQMEAAVAIIRSVVTTGSQHNDIPTQIASLAELRRQGILTEAEFQRKKADLLTRM
jgi:hypothetical protein